MKTEKYVFVYFDKKKLCENPQEAIGFINSLTFMEQGKRPLSCTDRTCEIISKLFANGTPVYVSVNHTNQPVAIYNELSVEGCNQTRVKFYKALADTIEEHDAKVKENFKAEEDKKREETEAAIQRRLNELYEPRKGWYSVDITFERAKFGRGGVYYVESNFSADCIANSGADAYHIAIAELQKKEDVLRDSIFPELHSHNFEFEFLGVKTDEGYSVKKWEDWKSKGEI